MGTADPTVAERLREKARALPSLPGVYVFKNAAGTVLYVGKSVSLHQRVATYFQGQERLGPRIARMVASATDLEYFVTSNEEEALLLEFEFIDRYSPRYNIVFRDDKSYPYVKVTDEEFPRIYFTRKPHEGKGLILGPYTDAASLRKTLRFLRTIFPVRSCAVSSDRLHRRRACLEYHIKRCLAPCEKKVDAAAYRNIVESAVLFLRGKSDELVRSLRTQMEEAAGSWDLEKAAELKRQVSALERVFTRQQVSAVRDEEYDALALAAHQHLAVVQLIQVREGRIRGQLKSVLKNPQEGTAEILGAFIRHHYLGAESFPTELLLPEDVPDRELLGRVLSQKAGRTLQLLVPQKGRKHTFVQMALKNAALFLSAQGAAEGAGEALAELARALGLDRSPRRIECFDVSHTGGTETVASMVVAQDGVPDRSQYRCFKIRTVVGADDFDSMREVVGRRYSRVLSEGQPLPDMVLIDGGIGQLGAAKEALLGLGLGSLQVVALAKQEELLFSGQHAAGLALPEGSGARRLVQRIRDEAHRFAVSYHRRLRSARATRSALDEVPGVGPRTRSRLLIHFGAIQAVREASLAELEAVPGVTRRAAQAVFGHFRR
ncbi:MAG: excinuclease ABC subunit UvrC [Candidatus Riflebacteria bacterium]|nr:excinuclease ABC subunit UvrC [Candidatus Riflebacteria bacterium]